MILFKDISLNNIHLLKSKNLENKLKLHLVQIKKKMMKKLILLLKNNLL